MKTIVILFLTLFVACATQSPEPIYVQGTPQYDFFQTLKDSLDLDVLNPARATTLVSSKEGNITTFDIMPPIYMQFSRFSGQINRIPVDQLKVGIREMAKNKGERLLIVSEAKQNQITAHDSVLNAQMETIFMKYGGREKFEKFVNDNGLNLDYVRNDVQEMILTSKFFEVVIDSSIEATETDLENAYAEDKTATVRHILFMTQGKSAEEKAEVMEKAENVLALAKSGSDFAELAEEFSEDPGSKDTGGLYENFSRGAMVKPFEDASFNLPVGSVSDLVETMYGYHIIQVIERKKETRPLDEVREELKNSLMQRKKQEKYLTTMEELKNKADYQEHFEPIG